MTAKRENTNYQPNSPPKPKLIILGCCSSGSPLVNPAAIPAFVSGDMEPAAAAGDDMVGMGEPNVGIGAGGAIAGGTGAGVGVGGAGVTVGGGCGIFCTSRM